MVVIFLVGPAIGGLIGGALHGFTGTELGLPVMLGIGWMTAAFLIWWFT